MFQNGNLLSSFVENDVFPLAGGMWELSSDLKLFTGWM